ncbi:MAG TPA: R3H domain-containing nucleic acid-binding protein [Baekduia sp.]|nr:R3H domain-containing nucleic acid-binding protein [Baekduia sp.]
MAPRQAPQDELLAEFLEHVASGLGLNATVRVTMDDDEVCGVLEGDDLGIFIGRHGATIEAVQHLAQRMLLADPDAPRRRIVVDAAGYRARRREALQKQADQAAADALRGERPVALDAMTASERKIVHEHLRDRDDIETYSEGDEPERHLVVAPRSA